MIGKIKGVVDEIGEDFVIIDVNGVGYYIFASGRNLQQFVTGEAVALFIETHVREDHIHLYGFASASEQQWFRRLTSVNGVGAKMALAVQSALTPEQISTALISQDKTAFTQISGIGPKMAARIINELKDKAGSMDIPSIPAVNSGNVTSITTGATPPQNKSAADAISALTNLGYGRSDAYMVVTRLVREDNSAKVEDLIKLGLKELA